MYDSDPSEENRKNFVVVISNLMKKANLAGEMIFDMPLHHEITYPHTNEKPPLVICYAPTNLEADDLIVEKLYAYKKVEDVIVVTSDRGLKLRVREVGANVLLVKNFLSLLRKKNNKQTEEKKPHNDSKSHIDRLEEIFIKKLKNTNE